jgi:membrane protein implicated in regulation of membrane protease activity
MIAIGGLAVIVSVIGLAAAITENAILLTVYIVLLFIIFLGEIACGILAIVYQDKIEEEANKSMTHSIQRSMKADNPYYNGTGRVCMASDDGEIWDYIQVKFECCGAGSYALSGYENAEIYLPSICPQLNLKANKPLTCCSHRVVDMDTIDSANQSSALDKFDCDQIISYGCTDAIVDWIAKYAPVLIGVGIGLGMFELIIILFALCVCQHRDTKD